MLRIDLARTRARSAAATELLREPQPDHEAYEVPCNDEVSVINSVVRASSCFLKRSRMMVIGVDVEGASAGGQTAVSREAGSAASRSLGCSLRVAPLEVFVP